MKCIANAFSLNMLKKLPATIYIREADDDEVKDKLLELKSFVGHESTAKLISDKLGERVEFNRQPVELNVGDSCYIFQLTQRLPEGKVLTDEEIKNIKYKWYKVSVLDAELL